MQWTIKHEVVDDKDDIGYFDSWTVSNGARSFRCESADDAEWLRDVLGARSE